MMDGRHNANRKIWRYLNKESSDFDEIWYTDADLELGDSQMIFKNSRWQTTDILEIVFWP